MKAYCKLGILLFLSHSNFQTASALPHKTFESCAVVVSKVAPAVEVSEAKSSDSSGLVNYLKLEEDFFEFLSDASEENLNAALYLLRERLKDQLFDSSTGVIIDSVLKHKEIKGYSNLRQYTAFLEQSFPMRRYRNREEPQEIAEKIQAHLETMKNRPPAPRSSIEETAPPPPNKEVVTEEKPKEDAQIGSPEIVAEAESLEVRHEAQADSTAEMAEDQAGTSKESNQVLGTASVSGSNKAPSAKRFDKKVKKRSPTRIKIDEAKAAIAKLAPVPDWVESAPIARAATLEERQSAEAFNRHFKALDANVLERAYLSRIAKLMLVTEELLAMMGPPGVAKSQLAKTLFRSIDGATNWSRQITPETTLDDTMGETNVRELLTGSGRLTRHYEDGILGADYAFLDEYFDGSPNQQRSLLTAMIERVAEDGKKTFKGKLKAAMIATNLYLSQIYAKAGDSRPRAVLDRIAYLSYVPSDFENIESYLALYNLPKMEAKIHQREIDRLKKMLPDVVIPKEIGILSVILFQQLRNEFRTKEFADAAHNEKAKLQRLPSKIPYHSTKEFSPRTFGKMINTLRATVALRAASNDHEVPLIATEEDLAQLDTVLTMNGPDTEFAEHLKNQSPDPAERNELESILYERETFQKTLQGILDNYRNNEAFKDLEEVKALPAYDLKQLDTYIRLIARSRELKASIKVHDLTPEAFAEIRAGELAEKELKSLVQNIPPEFE